MFQNKNKLNHGTSNLTRTQLFNAKFNLLEKMSKSGKKRDAVNSESTSVVLDGGEEDKDGESSLIPNWRLEMRAEIRAAISETLNETPLRLAPGPSEIDAADVIDSTQYEEMMRKIESNAMSSKTALRLSGITKEGNKQHFMDMV